MKNPSLFFLSTLLILSPCLQADEITCYPTSVYQTFAKREAAISQEKKQQINCALSAFDTLLSQEVIYVSCPITSGKRLYAYMDAQGFTTYEQAKKDGAAFFENVIFPNIQESETVSQLLANQGVGTVICPTFFERRFQGTTDRWEQNEFMSLWLSMIDQKVTRMVLLDGWQYSSGATEEYLCAVLMQMGFGSRSNILIVDSRGKEIDLNQGISLIYEALYDLQERNLKSPKLAETLFSLLETESLFRSLASNEVSIQRWMYDRDLIQKITMHIKELFKEEYPDLLPLAGAHIEGNIRAPLLHIEEGVTLNGRVEVAQESTPSSSEESL